MTEQLEEELSKHTITAEVHKYNKGRYVAVQKKLIPATYFNVYNLSKIINNNINTLDNKNIKSAHFIRGTKFDRRLFRSLYPSLKIKQKAETADVVIYDDEILQKALPRTNNYELLLHNKTNKYYDYYVLRYVNRIPREDIVRDYKNMSHKPYYHVNDIIKYMSKVHVFISDKPKINARYLFQNGKSDVRAIELTEEKANELFRQSKSKDKNTLKLACDIVCSLNTKYLPFQYVIYCNLLSNNFKNSKLKTLEDFARFSYVSVNNTNLLDYIDNIVQYFEKNKIFTDDMNYDLLFKALLKNNSLCNNFKHINLYGLQIKIDTPKIQFDSCETQEQKEKLTQKIEHDNNVEKVDDYDWSLV